MNTRNNNILNIIKKYQNTLTSLNMDIAHSTFTDRWYLFKYDTQYHNYEFFVEITDAHQLINALLSELSFEMYLEIGIDDIDTPGCEKNKVADRIEYYKNQNCLPRITALLEYIKKNTTVNDSILLKTLESLMKDR